MFMETIWLLMAFGLSLAGISAIADDRRILIPAGVIFIVISMMIVPTGIQIEKGVEINTNISESKTAQTTLTDLDSKEAYWYKNIDDQYNLDMSTYIAVLFAGVGLFFTLTGVAGRGGVEAVPFRR